MLRKNVTAIAVAANSRYLLSYDVKNLGWPQPSPYLSSQEAAKWVLARPAVSSHLTGEQLTSPGSGDHVTVGNIELPAGCWMKGLSVFLSAHQSTPSVSCQVSLPKNRYLHL